MNSRKVFLITGASGFIGTALCKSIRRSDDVLKLLVRKEIPNVDCDQFVFENADDINQDIFLGVDVVIHLAGYFLPLYKSNDKISIIKSIKSILLLPFIGMVIDIARLCGYLLGYMDRLFGNSNN